jgi:membrane-associated PAP2 superfamily phosphatase
MQDRETLWWSHARWPLLFFVIIATVLEIAAIDQLIAHAWYYDSTRSVWVGGKTTVSDLILHVGAARAVRGVAASVILLWMGSFVASALHPLRRSAAFLILAMSLSVGLVGLLKQLTNIDCPWDLLEFGG